jgi:hypothetical protein
LKLWIKRTDGWAARHKPAAEYYAESGRAIRALFRLVIGLAFFERQRKEHVAGPAVTDLKVRNTLLIDFRRKQKLSWIIAHKSVIAELHHCKPVVEGFKGGFLPFATQHMPQGDNRLPFPLDPEIFEGSLSSRGTGKLTGRTGSNPGHTIPLFHV